MSFIVLGSRSWFLFSGTRREPKYINMLQCVLPHIGQKRGIDKFDWEVWQWFSPVPCVFIEIQLVLLFLGSRVFGFRFFRSRRTKTCYSVYYYPTQGRKGVSINSIGRYCRVLSQFRMFLSRQNDFCCFSGRVPGFVFSGTHWEPKYGKHAKVCITSHMVEKGYR